MHDRGTEQNVKTETAYLEIFRNLEQGRVRYNSYLDDMVESEVKCIST
jgi:hypothetical protein